MANVSSIQDLLKDQEQMDLKQPSAPREISNEAWRHGLRRLRALHPNADWPAFDDSGAWNELIKEWQLALKKMSQDQWMQAVDYYQRSSQIKYQPSPAAMWQVVAEIPEIDQREREAGASERWNDRSQRESEKRAKWAGERVSGERAAEHMAKIRAENPRMFR